MPTVPPATSVHAPQPQACDHAAPTPQGPAPEDFERLYAQDGDPWRVATSWYERRKSAVLLACLRRERHRLAWDPACGTGELAALLAERADAVLAGDVSRRACELTRRRCADLPGVEVAPAELPVPPAELAGRAPDLVVLSEVLYYLRGSERAATAEVLADVCAPDADVVAVHWSDRPEGARVSGLDAHRAFDRRLVEHGWGRLVAHRDVEFTLTLWSRDVPDMIGR